MDGAAQRSAGAKESRVGAEEVKARVGTETAYSWVTNRVSATGAGGLGGSASPYSSCPTPLALLLSPYSSCPTPLALLSQFVFFSSCCEYATIVNASTGVKFIHASCSSRNYECPESHVCRYFLNWKIGSITWQIFFDNWNVMAIERLLIWNIIRNWMWEILMISCNSSYPHYS